MKIGIDISQIAYSNTGVSEYLKKLVHTLLVSDLKNTYILFYSSLRKKIDISFLKDIKNPRVEVKIFHFPQSLLNLIWNQAHIFPIENLIGRIDLFLSSDWLEPPVMSAKKATIIYDMIVYKNPKETDEHIVKTQKRRLGWVKNETDLIFCISKSTARDVSRILEIDRNKIKVIYPGL